MSRQYRKRRRVEIEQKAEAEVRKGNALAVNQANGKIENKKKRKKK